MNLPYGVQVRRVERFVTDLHGQPHLRHCGALLISRHRAHASLQQIAAERRHHRGIDKLAAPVRDVTFAEDPRRFRTAFASRIWITVSLRKLATSALRPTGHTNIAVGLRWTACLRNWMVKAATGENSSATNLSTAEKRGVAELRKEKRLKCTAAYYATRRRRKRETNLSTRSSSR